MKKMTSHSAVALLLGAVGTYVFFALIGVVKVLSMKQGFHRWIFNLPKSIQGTAFLIHGSIEDLIVSLVVFGSFGIIIGKLIEEKPLWFGFIEFVGAATFYFIYHYLVLHGDFLWMEDAPALIQLLPFLIWLLICLSAPLIGYSKFRRHLPH